jgi:hypothetical protein
MKFSTLVVLTALSTASAFVPHQAARQPSLLTRPMALEDLEAKLLGSPATPPPVKFSTPKVEVVEQEVKKVEKVVRRAVKEAKVEAPKLPDLPKISNVADKVEEEVKKAVEPAKRSFAQPQPRVREAVPPKPEIVSPPPKPELKIPSLPKPEIKAPKPAAVAKPTTGADPLTVPKGIALGVAPLALPLVALAGARNVLSRTAARREQIQKEIAAEELRRQQQSKKADVDAGGIISAGVSPSTLVCVQ